MKKLLALILAILMLCSVVAVAAFAEDAPAGDTPEGETPAVDQWEALYAGYGINIYIGAPTEIPPVLDGTIAPSEYTYEKVTPYVNLKEDAPGEIQSELKTFYAHDENYIYIAAQFEQKHNDRAFWIQWKPTNDFDVFNGNADMAKYYYQRCSTQLRILDDGSVTTKNESNPKGYFSWNNTWDKALPTDGLITAGDKEYNYQAAKITDEDAGIYTKTYEVRVAKSYIAKTAGCEVSDVRVMPFWIWFHANLCFCAPLSDEMAVEIFENKLDAYISSDPQTYWFLVCDEAPEGYEEAIGLPYTPPVEEGDPIETPATTTTAAATTTAAETTAAATTAAATTAAETEAEKTGCGASLTVSAIAILPTIAGGALLLKRRKED